MAWATREEEPPLATGKPKGMWGTLQRAVRDHHPTLSKPPTPYRPTFSPSQPGYYRPPVREEFACVADYQEARADYRKRMRYNRGKGVQEEEELQWQGRGPGQRLRGCLRGGRPGGGGPPPFTTTTHTHLQSRAASEEDSQGEED